MDEVLVVLGCPKAIIMAPIAVGSREHALDGPRRIFFLAGLDFFWPVLRSERHPHANLVQENSHVLQFVAVGILCGTTCAGFQIFFHPADEIQNRVAGNLVNSPNVRTTAKRLKLLDRLQVGLDRALFELLVLDDGGELPSGFLDAAAFGRSLHLVYWQLALAYLGEVALDTLELGVGVNVVLAEWLHVPCDPALAAGEEAIAHDMRVADIEALNGFTRVNLAVNFDRLLDSIAPDFDVDEREALGIQPRRQNHLGFAHLVLRCMRQPTAPYTAPSTIGFDPSQIRVCLT